MLHASKFSSHHGERLEGNTPEHIRATPSLLQAPRFLRSCPYHMHRSPCTAPVLHAHSTYHNALPAVNILCRCVAPPVKLCIVTVVCFCKLKESKSRAKPRGRAFPVHASNTNFVFVTSRLCGRESGHCSLDSTADWSLLRSLVHTLEQRPKKAKVQQDQSLEPAYCVRYYLACMLGQPGTRPQASRLSPVPERRTPLLNFQRLQQDRDKVVSDLPRHVSQ